MTNAPRPHHPAHNTYLMNLCRTRLSVIFPFFTMSYYAALLLLHHHRRYNDNSRCFSSLCGGQISPARRNLIDTDHHHRSSLFDVSLLPGSDPGSVPVLSLPPREKHRHFDLMFSRAIKYNAKCCVIKSL